MDRWVRRWLLFLLGYRYAVAVDQKAACYRLHRIGCYQLLPKRYPIRVVHFRSVADVEAARGGRLADKDYLDCQACIPEGCHG